MPDVLISGLPLADFLDTLRAVVRHEMQGAPAGPDALADTARPDLMTVGQTAALLDLAPQTVHEWARRGLLTPHKLGGRTYFRRAEVLAAPKPDPAPTGTRPTARRGRPSSTPPAAPARPQHGTEGRPRG